MDFGEALGYQPPGRSAWRFTGLTRRFGWGLRADRELACDALAVSCVTSISWAPAVWRSLRRSDGARTGFNKLSAVRGIDDEKESGVLPE